MSPARWSCTPLSRTRSKYGGRRLEGTRLVPPYLSPLRLGSSYSYTFGVCWVANGDRRTAQSSTLPATTRGTSSTAQATRTQQSDGTRSRVILRSAGNVCRSSTVAPNADVWRTSDAPLQAPRAPSSRTQSDPKLWHHAGTVDGHRASAVLCGVSDFRCARLGTPGPLCTCPSYAHSACAPRTCRLTK